MDKNEYEVFVHDPVGATLFANEVWKEYMRPAMQYGRPNTRGSHSHCWWMKHQYALSWSRFLFQESHARRPSERFYKREKWTIWDEIHVIFAVFRLFSIIQIMFRRA